jgi:hypothetical protein
MDAEEETAWIEANAVEAEVVGRQQQQLLWRGTERQKMMLELPHLQDANERQ